MACKYVKDFQFGGHVANTAAPKANRYAEGGSVKAGLDYAQNAPAADKQAKLDEVAKWAQGNSKPGLIGRTLQTIKNKAIDANPNTARMIGITRDDDNDGMARGGPVTKHQQIAAPGAYKRGGPVRKMESGGVAKKADRNDDYWTVDDEKNYPDHTVVRDRDGKMVTRETARLSTNKFLSDLNDKYPNAKPIRLVDPSPGKFAKGGPIKAPSAKGGASGAMTKPDTFVNGPPQETKGVDRSAPASVTQVMARGGMAMRKGSMPVGRNGPMDPAIKAFKKPSRRGSA